MSPRDGRVGVVVLTHDRAGDLARTLAHLRALPERPRLIVVDNASQDGTAALLARDFPEVAAIRLPENVGAAGRNAGVRPLGTPYVAFCDDDAWWAAGALSRAADLLDTHPRLAVVTARVLVGPEEREDPTCRTMAASPLPAAGGLPGCPVLGFMAGAAVVRRRAFLEVGGFDRRLFLGAEELLVAIDLAARGWAMAYVPDVVVHHHPSARRDQDARRRLVLRNRLWCAWLRRPWPAALRLTARTVTDGPLDTARLRALGEALAGLPWVLRERRPVPAAVEATLRRLEAGRSSAVAPWLLPSRSGVAPLRGEGKP